MDREKGIGKIADVLLELLYPTRCCFCRRLTGRGVTVCPSCAAVYPDVPPAMQTQRLDGLEACLSPLWYAGQIREALLRYKFQDRRGYAPVFGGFMAKCLDENGISCDSITWAPLSRRRLRSRGYDQAGLLAATVAERTGLPCQVLLEKTKHTRPQSGLKRREARRENAAGAYRAVNTENIAGKRILLVDDIVTTGETLMECARVLKAAGARSVTAVTAARRRDRV